MNKILISLLAVSFIGFSCDKEENLVALPFNEQLTIDSLIVENYLIDKGISNVLKDCFTGNSIDDPCDGYVSYVLHEEGNGLTPLSTDNIQVSYKGSLMDTGVEFEAKDTVNFNLGGLIAGWRVVLLDMQEGDSVTMYIPSGLAYGFAGSGDNIPSNANLIFEMKLHKVNQ